MSERYLKGIDMIDSVLEVSKDVYAIPSQTRPGKAHIVNIVRKFEEVSILGDIIVEANEVMRISNCSKRYDEYVKRSKDLIHRLTLYEVQHSITYSCSCKDYRYNCAGKDKKCKHIIAVKLHNIQKESDQTCLADFGPNVCAANKQPNASSPAKMRNTARAYDH